MKLLKRILVATDFSKSSDNVVENAIDVAKIFESEIVLIYVLPEDIGSKKASDLLYDFAKKQLDILNTRIQDLGISTLSPILEIGDFSEKIVESSEKLNVNIIFAGAGEKVEDNLIKLGSNAQKIIKKSSKPVFIVNEKTSLNIRKILCPIDFSLESKRALSNAIALAHKFNACLIVISVYEVSQLFHISNTIQMDEHLNTMRKNCENKMDSFLNEFTLVDIELTKEVKPGKPATEILNAIKEHDVDLLIMGTTGKSGINRILIGSVTESVIREIPCSFITLKKEDAIILELEENLRDIEHRYNIAKQLDTDGFFDESIAEYKKCIEISFMHLPSIQGLSEVYKKLGDTENENKYKSMLERILEKMNYKKIESEIRKYRA